MLADRCSYKGFSPEANHFPLGAEGYPSHQGGMFGDGGGRLLDSGCETCETFAMKTMTIRDLRQRWPEAEKALATESEILVTRDGIPVARLLPIVKEETPKKRFDPAEQRRLRKEFWGDEHFDSLTPLLADREDRKLI